MANGDPGLAKLTGHLSRSRDRDLEGRGYQVWTRRILLGLLVGLVLCALLNVFGQRSSTTAASAAGATLAVSAPERLRGGLFFEGRFEIDAHQRIKRPRLVLAPGWTEGMTLNTSVPEPTTEGSRGRSLILGFDPIPAGTQFTFWSQWQVNPVNSGTRSQDVALYDGRTHLASVDRTVTIFP
jgi:hypothetical protein